MRVPMRGAASLLAAAAFTAAAPAAGAAPLEQVKRNGALNLCANPTALPYSNRDSRDGPPGFQVELADAIARELRLGLSVAWIWERPSAARVDCDMLMDTIIIGPGLTARSRAVPPRLTRPYFGTGVVLVVRTGTAARRFEDLKGVKIGVVPGTVTHQWLQQRGLTTSSFVFQDEIVEAVARGEVGAGAVAAPYVGWYRKTHPEAGIEIPPGFEIDPELRWNVAIGLRRADDALVEAVDGALGRLLETRAVHAIYARYGVEYRPPFER